MSNFHEKEVVQILTQYTEIHEPELISDNLISDYFIDAPQFDENDKYLAITLGDEAHLLVWETPEKEYKLMMNCPDCEDELEFEKKPELIRFFRKLNLDDIVLYNL